MGTLQVTREYRNMPFLKRGMRCNMNGKWGRITSGDGAGLRVRFDGEKFTKRVHPWWEMTYYDQDGNVVRDYKEAK